MFDRIPAFSSFSVHDVSEAHRFYGETLGLPTSLEHGMLLITLGTGAEVLLYPKDDHQPATHTVLMFPVTDIEAAVAEAKSRGITFEALEGVGADGIMPARGGGPANAWFKDPSGNWISIVQDVYEPTSMERAGRAVAPTPRTRACTRIGLNDADTCHFGWPHRRVDSCGLLGHGVLAV